VAGIRTASGVSRLPWLWAAIAVPALIWGLVGDVPVKATPVRVTLDALAGPAAAADLDVMTFNLRQANGGPPTWERRRPGMRQLLTTERPHLIGTQEGLAHQITDIETDLGGRYGRVGVGRRGGTKDEYMAIFYDTARLRVLEQRHFWLSDTPEVPGSNTWGGKWIRMVTWVRFLDRVTGGQLYAVNTHLDPASAYSRERSAQLIRDRLAALAPGVPVVLTGDFNSEPRPGNPVYDILTGPAGLVDTWRAAAATGPVYRTFHNFEPVREGGARIDWILATRGATVAAAAINTYSAPSGQRPSDHFPVQVRLRLPVATVSDAALDD
jgi:endonuclease/exonuclease/phosphatase family metal-dependent hydrolase